MRFVWCLLMLLIASPALGENGERIATGTVNLEYFDGSKWLTDNTGDMSVEKISPEKTPELFYLDDGGEWVTHLDVSSSFLSHDYAVRRKSENGYQTHLIKDNIVILQENGELIATGTVNLEYFDGSKWRTDNTGVVIVMDNETGKQTFMITKPGFKIRCKWVVDITDNTNLNLDYSDYKGNTTDDEDNPRTIIFEPDGVMDKLTVDPFLSTDIQATYFLVFCDGFMTIVYFGNTESDGGFGFLNMGNRVYIKDSFRSGGTTYGLHFDRTRTGEIVEESPSRVVIKVVGFPDDTNQNGELSDDPFTVTYTIYPDRLVQTINWQINGGAITLDNTATNAFIKTDLGGYVTEETGIYEAGGSEVKGTGVVNSANYIGFEATQMSFIGVLLEESHTGGASFEQWVRTNSQQFFRWTNGDLNVGTHTMSVMWIIDHITRIGGNTVYPVGSRLDIGEQYRSAVSDVPMTAPTLNTGTWTTDLSGADSEQRSGASTIGIAGFATDGAWHLDLTSGTSEGKITWDTTRIMPNVVVEKWSNSGVSPEMEENGIRSDYNTGITYFMCNMAAEIAGISNFILVGGVTDVYDGYQDVAASETWEFDDSFAAPAAPSRVPTQMLITKLQGIPDEYWNDGSLSVNE